MRTALDHGPRRAWLIWGAGAGVYVLAVFHRSTLGVAGPMAADRLQISAGQLSSFVMLQLGLYAVMQVPTGILIDRFGPRRMLLAATLTMGAAQILFSLVATYPLALLARGLLGAGDAMTYISVLRLAAGWFPPRQYAMITAYTGVLGTTGNLIATLPLTGLLNQFGWTATFAVAGGMSLLYSVVLVRKATVAPFKEVATVAAAGPVAGSRVWSEVKTAWGMPSGRLGFWVHFTTMAGPVVFASLWGFPYLEQVVGATAAVASTVLMAMVLAGLVSTLVIGQAVGRKPEIRTPLGISVSLACLLGWLTLIGWPGGHPPLPVVVVVVVVFSTGGPASAVGFMLARDYNPEHRISTATGLVNIGGFCGAVLGVFAVGQILGLVDGPLPGHSSLAYRWAFGALAALTALGLWRVLTWWLRTRAVVLLAAARGEAVPVRIVPHRWELVDEAILAEESARARETELVRAAEQARQAADTALAEAADQGIQTSGDDVPTGPIPVVQVSGSGGQAGGDDVATGPIQMVERS